MNHPSWILGHLSIYYPIVPALLRAAPFDDPADDPLFGFRGRGPLPDLDTYGTKESQLKRFTEGHERVAAALLSATPEQLNQRPSLARWAEMYPTVEFMLPDLLLHHESLHIGQLSLWPVQQGCPESSSLIGLREKGLPTIVRNHELQRLLPKLASGQADSVRCDGRRLAVVANPFRPIGRSAGSNRATKDRTASFKTR